MTCQPQKAAYANATKINSFDERFKATPKSTLPPQRKRDAATADEQIYEGWVRAGVGVASTGLKTIDTK